MKLMLNEGDGLYLGLNFVNKTFFLFIWKVNVVRLYEASVSHTQSCDVGGKPPGAKTWGWNTHVHIKLGRNFIFYPTIVMSLF